MVDWGVLGSSINSLVVCSGFCSIETFKATSSNGSSSKVKVLVRNFANHFRSAPSEVTPLRYTLKICFAVQRVLLKSIIGKFIFTQHNMWRRVVSIQGTYY